MPRDFPAEEQALRAELGSVRWQAVYGLRQLEEDWARHLLDIGQDEDLAKAMRKKAKTAIDLAAAEQAARHLAEAEQWQWEIGSYATGSGEGLRSMGEVRTLQVARAWLAAALSRADERQSEAQSTLARSLMTEVESDSNGMGKPYAALIRELRRWLDE